jgi:hypothetical protein
MENWSDGIMEWWNGGMVEAFFLVPRGLESKNSIARQQAARA